MWHLCGLLVVTLLAMLPSKAKGAYEDQDLMQLVSGIWDADPNRLKIGKDLKLDWQAFISLLDNYEHRVGFSEVETPEEKAEIQRFLDAVLSTSTMRSFYAYLSKLKLVSPVITEFKEELRRIWFKPYKRIRRGDSSPFEHVFVGETKQENVLGMHNWITFCLNEKEGIVDYHGYSRPKAQDPDFKRSLRFSMHDSFEKAYGTMLIGSSVEFEFGLFTTIFLRARELFRGQQDWPPFLLMLEGKKVLVQCHPKDKNRMGSCYFM
ncbi:Poly U specific endoribonuclease-A [Taenia solium]|eukprot:TsM_000318200 transcript=TsM_000318200 gene=TsM_000318200